MTAQPKRGKLRKDKGRQQNVDKLIQTKKDLQKKILPLRGERWGSNPRPLEPQSNALTN